MRRERRAANLKKMRPAIRNVAVEIDELILHGFSAADRYRIGDAFSYELSQLVTESEARQFSTNDVLVPLLRAEKISIQPNAKPALIGTQVAQTVFTSLNKVNKGSQP